METRTIIKWLSEESQIMRALTSASINRGAVLLGCVATPLFLFFSILAAENTGWAMFHLLLAFECILPMTVQFAKTATNL